MCSRCSRVIAVLSVGSGAASTPVRQTDRQKDFVIFARPAPHRTLVKCIWGFIAFGFRKGNHTDSDNTGSMSDGRACVPTQVQLRVSSSAYDTSRPPAIPGGGLVLTPLTVKAALAVDVIHTIVQSQLRACQMTWGYEQAAHRHCYHVDAASVVPLQGRGTETRMPPRMPPRFRIYLWSACDDDDSCAVEVMRKRGDRIVSIRFFQLLEKAVKAVEAGEAGRLLDAASMPFHPDMLSWTPRACPVDERVVLTK